MFLMVSVLHEMDIVVGKLGIIVYIFLQTLKFGSLETMDLKSANKPTLSLMGSK